MFVAKSFIMSNGITCRPLTGIILAGGKSSRMGREKGMVPFRGKPLIRYSLEVLEPLCDHLLISANDPGYEVFGYPVLPDHVTGAGPLAGLCAALEKSTTRGNLVLPCDMPFVTEEFLEYLLCCVRDQKAVIPVHPDGRAEPLCGYYSREILPFLKKNLEEKNYKLIRVLQEADAFFLKLDETLPFYNSRLFTNLNKPEELRTPPSSR